MIHPIYGHPWCCNECEWAGDGDMARVHHHNTGHDVTAVHFVNVV